MLPLKSHLNSLDDTKLTLIKELLDKAQAKNSFWANRVIEVNGFKGSVYLEERAYSYFIWGSILYRRRDPDL